MQPKENVSYRKHIHVVLSPAQAPRTPSEGGKERKGEPPGPRRASPAGVGEAGAPSARPVVGGAEQLTQLAREDRVVIILGTGPHANGVKDLLACLRCQVVLRAEHSPLQERVGGGGARGGGRSRCSCCSPCKMRNDGVHLAGRRGR